MDATEPLAVAHGLELPPQRLSTSVAVLTFDGTTVYLSTEEGLQVFAFNATSDEMAQAPTIRFSHHPLAMVEVDGALVVASAHELVTLSPACTGR